MTNKKVSILSILLIAMLTITIIPPVRASDWYQEGFITNTFDTSIVTGAKGHMKLNKAAWTNAGAGKVWSAIVFRHGGDDIAEAGIEWTRKDLFFWTWRFYISELYQGVPESEAW